MIRLIARVLVVLFCMMFIANRLHSQEPTTALELLLKLGEFTAYGVKMCATSINLNAKRIDSIQKHLINYNPTTEELVRFKEIREEIDISREEYLDTKDEFIRLINEELR